MQEKKKKEEADDLDWQENIVLTSFHFVGRNSMLPNMEFTSANRETLCLFNIDKHAMITTRLS